MNPPVPPWEPIADWLCRIEDGTHGTVSKGKMREHHEAEAKAIAYDIAVESSKRGGDPRGMQKLDPEDLPPAPGE